MKDDFHNSLPIVMFRGTPCIFINGAAPLVENRHLDNVRHLMNLE